MRRMQTESRNSVRLWRPGMFGAAARQSGRYGRLGRFAPEHPWPA